tara:strand:- start:227 stop:373 length:147 start_codon:yes stop_codon:yes gene_type:complete
MFVLAFDFDTNLDVEFRTMTEAIIFFTVVYGYSIGMIAMAIIMHRRNK